MGMSGGGGGDKAVPYINVTPLIDVLLVLLIIFMVVTPLKPSRFEAKVPSEPDPQQSQDIKPNPLTLVVTIAPDLKLKLNLDDMGSVNDTAPLASKLAYLFQQRKEQNAFRAGTTEVEKTVFVKAPRSMHYGEVVKVIDAIKGAGANPVGLQIDDLAQ
ncbi:MAG TPA: biopolymer transporter ExbD [Pyrinomonadaceae bacterium]|jgi:biopolymer transport protein ExbD